jgi:hypothetical protein
MGFHSLADAEQAIAARYPGSQQQVMFTTSEGVRRVDVLTPSGEAIESKVGSVSLTERVSQQVAKDAILINARNPRVRSATWEFAASPITGRSGPSAPLRALLEQEGIGIR